MTVPTFRATMRGAAFTLALAVTASAASSGCNGDGPSWTRAVPAPRAIEVAVSTSCTPNKPTIEVGDTVRLQGTAYASGGVVISGAVFTWKSVRPEIATVDSTGLVKGVAPGGTTIRGYYGTLTTSAFVTVKAPVMAAGVAVTPPSASAQVGSTLRLSATVTDAAGNVLTKRPLSWTSASPAVAAVDAAGNVTAAAVGTAAMVASVDGKADTATITVTPELAVSVSLTPTSATIQPGGTQQLAETAVGGSGNILSGRPASWSSSTPAVATVSGTGLVSAVAAGAAIVTVTVDGVSATSQITVPAPQPPPPPPPPPPAPTVGVLFQDNFENGFAAKQNNAGWKSTTPTNVSVSTDLAHSGSHSMRFTFPGKVDCSDASAQMNYTLGRNMPEFWGEWWVYFPKGGEGGSATYWHRPQTMCAAGAQSDNNKFFVLHGPQYGGQTTMSLQTWTTRLQAGSSRMNTGYAKALRNGVWFYAANNDPFITPADQGKWIQIRVHARVATVGQSDGVVEVWKDGVKILCNTALDWYDETGAANYFTQGYLMGWSNSGFAQTTNIYWDDVKFYDSDPGW